MNPPVLDSSSSLLCFRISTEFGLESMKREAIEMLAPYINWKLDNQKILCLSKHLHCKKSASRILLVPVTHKLKVIGADI